MNGKDSDTYTYDDFRSKVRDVAAFAGWQLASTDIDPVYPVLRELQREMSEDEALWFTFVYVAFYNLPSATIFYPELLKSLYDILPYVPRTLFSLPTGVERRGLRGGTNMINHLTDLVNIWEANGQSLRTWLTRDFTDDPRANWTALQATLRDVLFNGRWAAYKTGEILKVVNGFPVEPTDMGMAFSSGPRWGLDLLYGELRGNTPAVLRELDDRADDLLRILRGDYGLNIAIEQLETVLCDFHSLHEGRYYVGHDIDQMQEQILAAGDNDVLAALWDAREEALPQWTLGEVNGWQGVRKPLKTLYRETGMLDWWTLYKRIGDGEGSYRNA